MTDFDAIAQLAGALAHLQAAASAADKNAAATPWSAEDYAAFLQTPGVFVVLAEGASPGAGPRGFALGRTAGDEAELLMLAVAPAARRRGVASRLAGMMLAYAAGSGARRCFLEVAENNAPAQALYARLGFAAVGRRAGYYSDKDQGVAAIILQQLLGG